MSGLDGGGGLIEVREGKNTNIVSVLPFASMFIVKLSSVYSLFC